MTAKIERSCVWGGNWACGGNHASVARQRPVSTEWKRGLPIVTGTALRFMDTLMIYADLMLPALAKPRLVQLPLSCAAVRLSSHTSIVRLLSIGLSVQEHHPTIALWILSFKTSAS